MREVSRQSRRAWSPLGVTVLLAACGTPGGPGTDGEPVPVPYDLPLTGRIGAPLEVREIVELPVQLPLTFTTWQSSLCARDDGGVLVAAGAASSAGVTTTTARVTFVIATPDGTLTTIERELDVGAGELRQELQIEAIERRPGGYWLLGSLSRFGASGVEGTSAAAVQLDEDLRAVASYLAPSSVGRSVFSDVAERSDGTFLVAGGEPLGAIVAHLDAGLHLLNFDAHLALDDATAPADAHSSQATEAMARSIALDGDGYLLAGYVANTWLYDCGGSCAASRYYALVVRGVPGASAAWLRDLGPGDTFGGAILPRERGWLLASAQEDFRFTVLDRDGHPLSTRTLGGRGVDRLTSARLDGDGVLFCGHTESLPGGNQVLVGRIDGSLEVEWALPIDGGAGPFDGCDAARTASGDVAVVIPPTRALARLAWLPAP